MNSWRKTLRVSGIAVSFVLALLIGFSGVFSSSRTLDAATYSAIRFTGYYMPDEARAQLSLINEARRDENCRQLAPNGEWETIGSRQELVYDYTLEQIAMQRAREIVLHFDHIRPDGSLFNTVSIDGVTANNENIHWSSSFDRETVAIDTYESFLEEDEPYAGQGHRRTMFNDMYNAVGIAAFVYNDEIFWVQEFGYVATNTATPGAVNTSVDSYDTIYNDSFLQLEYGIWGGNYVRCDFGYELKFSNLSTYAGYNRVIMEVNPEGVTYEFVPENPSDFIITDTGIEAVHFGESRATAIIYKDGVEVNRQEYYFTVDRQVNILNVENNGNATSLLLPEVTYTGSAIVPELHLTYHGYELKENVDYVVSCENNIEVSPFGTYATITATGIGDVFTGTKTWSFKIVSSSSGSTDTPSTDVQRTPIVVRADDCRIQLTDTDGNGTYDQAIVFSGAGEVQKISEHIRQYVDDIVTLVIYQDTLRYSNDIASGLPNLRYIYLGCNHDRSSAAGFITDRRVTINVSHQAPTGCSENCPVCGTFIRANNNHTWGSEETVAATCTEDGYQAGRRCTVCGKVEAGEVIPATGHTVVTDAGYAATCTRDGLTNGSHCSTCGTVISARSIIPARGHSTVVDAAVPATCTTSGLTRGSHCSTCNTVLEVQRTVAATGHVSVENVSYLASTCSSAGHTAGTECRVCHVTLTQSKPIVALAHTETTLPGYAATCTRAGLTNGVYCSVCGTVIQERRTIPALGHAVVIDSAVLARWNATGLTEGRHCSRCGEVLVRQEVIPVETGVPGFVSRLYSCVFERNPDASGKTYWINKINSGMSGADVARQFFFSPEFINNPNISNTEYVTRLYRVFMNRNGESAGMAFWVNRLNSGWSREQVFDGFINSQEWTNICYLARINPGNKMTPTVERPVSQNIVNFATRLYTTCLKRNPDSGLSYWIREIDSGRVTGSEAARGFFLSPEFVNSNVSNADFVRRLYQTCMDRPGETDGINFWVNRIRSGWSRDRVLTEFVNSKEFRQLCSQWGIVHS